MDKNGGRGERKMKRERKRMGGKRTGEEREGEERKGGEKEEEKTNNSVLTLRQS